MFLIKAGESHGKAMVGMLCNVPAGIKVEESFINSLLLGRSKASGRSVRQNFENDKIDFITGLRGGITLGNNIAFMVKNAANRECEDIMGEFSADTSQPITKIRAAHADLPGLKRTGFDDIRNVMECSSARNTCLDVIGGGIALSMLDMLGIKISAFTRSLGGARDRNQYDFEDIKGVESPYFSINNKFINECKEELKKAENLGDTLGGSVEVMVKGLKVGFGSFVAEKRVNGAIARLIENIQSVKGIYFGENPFEFAKMGSDYVGEVKKTENDFVCLNSKSGGISGGMTEGGIINFTVAAKPIPTIKKGVDSCDYRTGEPCLSPAYRSDTTAVFALCPILKCVTALAITEIISERIGCDNMENIIKRYNEL